MTASCNKLALLRLLRGDLGDVAAADVSAHANGCGDCVADMCWLMDQRERYGRSRAPEPSLSVILWRRIARALSLVEIREPECAAGS